MSDDIVQELNDWAYIVDESQGKAVVVMLSGAVFREAAEEIGRLRDRLAACWATIDSNTAFSAEQEDKIERLRAAGDGLVAAIRTHDQDESAIREWENERYGR